MPQWIIYVIVVLILALFFLGWAWWQRSRYNKMVEGNMLCEFWPETGMRYKRLLPVEINGLEVKSPQGHQCPRYFFNKEATYIARYPDDPFLNLKFLQVDVPIVSWPENNPEPINPYRKPGELVATSALIDSLRDNDFAAFAMAASKEIQELQQELAKALLNNIPKRIAYVGGIVVGALALGALITGIVSYQEIGNLKALWGG